MNEQEAAILALKNSLHAHAKESILNAVAKHKANHGAADADRSLVAEALIVFCNFVGGNGKFVVGPDTDLLLNLGIDAISAGAAEARAESERSRILLV